jgi:protein TonB
MQSALSRQNRSSTGRAIAFALAVSVLLHAFLLLVGRLVIPVAQPPIPPVEPITLQMVIARPANVASTITRQTRTEPIAATTPATALPVRRHNPVLPSKPKLPIQANRTQPQPRTAQVKPTTQRQPRGTPADLSLHSLLQQAGETAPAGEAPVAPAGQLVYGSSATGPMWRQYQEDWVRKMERIGALNYPEEVRRLSLSGGPTLSVVINADGSLRSLRTARSSGNTMLDNAASNLVRSAAPFAPFPPSLAQQARSLEIRRKWTFSTDNDLSVH